MGCLMMESRLVKGSHDGDDGAYMTGFMMMEMKLRFSLTEKVL